MCLKLLQGQSVLLFPEVSLAQADTLGWVQPKMKLKQLLPAICPFLPPHRVLWSLRSHQHRISAWLGSVEITWVHLDTGGMLPAPGGGRGRRGGGRATGAAGGGGPASG